MYTRICHWSIVQEYIFYTRSQWPKGAVQRSLATQTVTMLMLCWQVLSDVELRRIFDVCNKRWANSRFASICEEKYGSIHEATRAIRSLLVRKCSTYPRPQPVALGKISEWNSFLTNQIYSDSFRNLYPHQSKLIRVNPKKVFNFVWCNSAKNQSVSIRVNPRFLILTKIQSDTSNPNESERSS